MSTVYSDTPKAVRVGLATADEFGEWWKHAERVPRVVAGAAGAVGALLVLSVVGLVLNLVKALVLWLVDVGRAGVDTFGDLDLVHVVTEPLTRYLHDGAAALSLPPRTVVILWAAAAGVALLGSLLRITGARIGWILTGAATVAMVYIATPNDGEGVAAAITLAAWSLLSIPAFWGSARRRPIRPQPIVLAGARRSTPDDED